MDGELQHRPKSMGILQQGPQGLCPSLQNTQQYLLQDWLLLQKITREFPLGTVLLKSKILSGLLTSLNATVRVSEAGKLAGTIYPLISPLLPQISIKRAGKESAQGKEAW